MFVLSGAAFYLMCRVTNRKIAGHQPENTEATAEDGAEKEPVEPYSASVRTVAVGISAAVLSAVSVYISFGTIVSPTSRVELCICLLGLLSAAVIDAKLRIIPNLIPLGFIGARLIIFVVELITESNAMQFMVGSLLGFALCAIMLFIAGRIAKGGIGGGDIKLLAAVGFLCGVSVIFRVLLLALLWCVALALVPLLLKKESIKVTRPFAPYIFLGFLTMCLLIL